MDMDESAIPEFDPADLLLVMGLMDGFFFPGTLLFIFWGEWCWWCFVCVCLCVDILLI